jgi:hypothetical protein
MLDSGVCEFCIHFTIFHRVKSFVVLLILCPYITLLLHPFYIDKSDQSIPFKNTKMPRKNLTIPRFKPLLYPYITPLSYVYIHIYMCIHIRIYMYKFTPRQEQPVYPFQEYKDAKKKLSRNNFLAGLEEGGGGKIIYICVNIHIRIHFYIYDIHV